MSLLDPRTWFTRSSPSTSLALRAENDGPRKPPSTRVVPGGTSTRRGNFDPARDASLEKSAATMARCFQGQVSEYIDLCKSTRRCDTRLNAVAVKRILAMQGRRWAIKPPPGYAKDRDAIENCALVTTHFNETRRFASMLGHLGHGVLEGHAGLQHNWYRNARGETATQPTEVHARLFGWNVETGQAGVYTGATTSSWRSTQSLTYLDDAPCEFVFHNPVAGCSDDPWLRGALRSRILPSITKRRGTAWWLKMLERWGQPQVVAIKGADDGSEGGEENDDEYLRMLRAIGSDWRAVLPTGTTIETISADIHPELHQLWVQKCDADDAIQILGQNLSTEVAGGSFAAARAHSWVLATILEADLAELSETITDYWIEPIIRFNRPGSPIPYLEINPSPLSEITPADMAIVDSKGRRPFSITEFRANRGYDARPEDSEADVIEADIVEPDVAEPTKALPANAGPGAAPVADIVKALEIGRGVGLQPTQAAVAALLDRMGVATEAIPDGAPQPKPIALAPTDIAKVVTVGEARGSQGLAPFGDDRDAKTITELDAANAAPAAPPFP